MAPNAKALLAKLDEIEAEMKAIGYWNDDPGPVPDNPLTMAGFEAWLQLAFLPSARKAVRTDMMPDKSEIGVLALRQYDYHAFVPAAQRLKDLLFEFDRMVIDVARTRKPRKKKKR